MTRYTAYIELPPRDDEVYEEIDIDASSEVEALEVATLTLAREYEPGASVLRIVEQKTAYQ